MQVSECLSHNISRTQVVMLLNIMWLAGRIIRLIQSNQRVAEALKWREMSSILMLILELAAQREAECPLKVWVQMREIRSRSSERKFLWLRSQTTLWILLGWWMTVRHRKHHTILVFQAVESYKTQWILKRLPRRIHLIIKFPEWGNLWHTKAQNDTIF